MTADAGDRGPSSFDPEAVRDRFPILRSSNGERLVYLDSAATAQRPDEVIDAVSAFYRSDNANVHRGIYDLSRRATERFEGARSTVARFLNAPDPAHVIWTRGTTEAINLVAATWGQENIGQGDEIVLTRMDHHSNLVPWQLLAQRNGAIIRYVDIDGEGRLRVDQYDDLLGERTKLVAHQPCIERARNGQSGVGDRGAGAFGGSPRAGGWGPGGSAYPGGRPVAWGATSTRFPVTRWAAPWASGRSGGGRSCWSRCRRIRVAAR